VLRLYYITTVATLRVASYSIFLYALSKLVTIKLAGVPAVLVVGPVLLAICRARAFALCTGVQPRATHSRVDEAQMPELPGRSGIVSRESFRLDWLNV
jgi:hypothetical protein